MTNTRKRLGMWPHITTSCQIHINFLNSEHSQTCGMEKRCVLTQPVRMENCEKCDVGAPSTVITGNGWTSYSFLWKLWGNSQRKLKTEHKIDYCQTILTWLHGVLSTPGCSSLNHSSKFNKFRASLYSEHEILGCPLEVKNWSPMRILRWAKYFDIDFISCLCLISLLLMSCWTADKRGTAGTRIWIMVAFDCSNGIRLSG